MTTDIHQFVPIDNLEADLLDALAAVSQSEQRFLKLLREFDWRQGWKAYGNADCAGWLAWRCKISRGTAVEKVRVAKALWVLPCIDAAFAEGQLTYSQVRAVTRVASATNESHLLDFALGSTADQLEQYCSRLRNGDPQESDSLARRQRERRSLTRYVRSDGSGTLTVDLPAAELQLVLCALEKMASALPDDSERSLFAKGADALVAMAQAQLGGAGEGASNGSAGYEVLVHVDASALSASSKPSAEGGCSDLPVTVVKRLCCDGAVRALVEDEQHNPIDVGRRQRTVSTALKRALQARDGFCRFPGCHHKRYIDAHHIRHWADGGETNLDNLILLCSHHHALVHEGGYSIQRWHDGSLYFKRPDGRPLTARLSAESRRASVV